MFSKIVGKNKKLFYLIAIISIACEMKMSSKVK